MSKRLFVGNLSWNTSEDDLVSAFAPYGSRNASIPVNEMGRSKGFGFVDVDDDKLDEAVAAWNGKELGGRPINVNEARPRTEGDRGGRSGGYGGGRDSGGYGGGNRW